MAVEPPYLGHSMLQNSEDSYLNIFKILWFALLGSQVVYGSLLPTIVGNYQPLELNLIMAAIFGLAGISMCILAYIISHWIFSKARQQLIKDYGSRPHYETSLLAPYFQTGFILRLAMIESCALLGFGLAVLHKRVELYYPFAALSMGLFVINFPSKEKIKNTFKS